ncbi:hypothetical protein KR200_006082, partial [Drosophila serrata]
FTGPGSISNAVHQYNVMRAAELAEAKRQKQRPILYPVFCKVRSHVSDVTSMVTSRDVDVVTQLSLDSDTTITNDYDDEDDYSNDGLKCGMGDAVRLCGGAESNTKAKGKGKGKGRGKNKSKTRKVKSPAKSSKKDQQPNQQLMCPDPEPHGDCLDKLKNLHLEVCAELQTLVAEEEGKKTSPPSSPRAKKVFKKIKRQNTKRQEGGEHQKKAQNQELSPRAGEQVCYEDYYLPQPKWVDIMPSAMMSQGIKVNVCTCPAATPQSVYKFMQQYGGMVPESLTPFFHEDSDLDHEFADRKGYLRYVEPRSQIVDKDCNDQVPKKINNHGSVVDPFFVELEKRPQKVSLLRSLSPMRYTSQCSELTLKPALIASPSGAVEAEVKGPAEAEVKVPPLELHSKKRRPKKVKVEGSATARSKQGPKSHGTKDRLPAGSQPEKKAPLKPKEAVSATTLIPSSLATAPAQVTTPKRQQKRRKHNSIVIYSKSLEDLKAEKMRIYNKISFTHERIIGAVDRLQLSLLQLPPARERSVPEQERLQRNAFEFCVRFSRNFLYPLKGMIDDVRLTPEANFSSAISNEACHRVMCVYGLMLQSLINYQRQLRFFLLEKVAQKLSALIEMIYTMTNCCLDKSILARHDPVVESLLERCTRFLSFIEDMQAERIKLARETERRSKIQSLQHVSGSSRLKSPRLGLAHSRHPKQEKQRSHERYDLKMCLNDSKVYEPRVVPKERPKTYEKVSRRRRRNPQVIATSVAEPPIELPSIKEDVRTQMQIQAANGAGDTTSSMSVATIESHGNGLRSRGVSPLREAMLEAVRRATRAQLQEVLDPMMRSLRALENEKMPKMGDQTQTT